MLLPASVKQDKVGAKILKRTILRLHYSVGLASALFVILLALTGLVLNHNDTWPLLQQPLPLKLAQSIYGLTPINHGKAEECPNAISVARISFADDRRQFQICSNGIEWLTAEGDLIERMTQTLGLPGTLYAYADCQNSLCINTSKGFFRFNETHWQAITAPQYLDWQHLSDAPLTSLTWERLVLDIHAGRFLGSFKGLLVDIIALAMIFLAVSGCYSWWQGRDSNR